MKTDKMNIVKLPKSKFLKVACKKCGNEQVIYNKASVVVKCLKCGIELAKPTGGEAEINGRVLKVLS
jgi:small subunit ribosomal protein S27e